MKPDDGTVRTYSGLRVDPLRLRPEDIRIEDIAHGLSFFCRFGGQCARWYGVGEHSYLVAMLAWEEAGLEAAMLGLFHDAHEAYSGDHVRPLKVGPAYADIRRIQDEEQLVIEEVLGLTGVSAGHRAVVESIDKRLVVDEAWELFPRDAPSQAAERNFRGVPIATMSPLEAEQNFLRLYRGLWRLAGRPLPQMRDL